MPTVCYRSDFQPRESQPLLCEGRWRGEGLTSGALVLTGGERHPSPGPPCLWEPSHGNLTFPWGTLATRMPGPSLGLSEEPVVLVLQLAAVGRPICPFLVERP